jgi:hypothetical protein
VVAAVLVTRVASAVELPAVHLLARVSPGAFDSPSSWLAGGWGKLVDGDQPGAASASSAIGETRLALDWEPAVAWRVVVMGVARRDAEAVAPASGSGLLEAYVERRRGFGEGQEIVARSGLFFLPGSRENIGPLWTSPYTLTLSALNSWIAEEIRPLGIDLAWDRTFPSAARLKLGGTIFGGNDTAGTLLAWRGFAVHDRPTPLGSFVPLPPVPALPTVFPEQTRRGTEPLGRDLDGRPGWAGHARWDTASGAVVEASIFDNNADRALHGGQYAWRTDFRWLGLETPIGRGLRLLGEWGTGTSRMGFDPADRRRAAVDILYDTRYLLASWQRGALRLSFRFEQFAVTDRDHTPGDDNNERGEAWTAAAMLTRGENWRAGVELLRLRATRPAARLAGTGSLDGDALRLELRYLR